MMRQIIDCLLAIVIGTVAGVVIYCYINGWPNG